MSFFATCVYLRRNLRAVWPPNASLYASSTCVHLRLLAGLFGQGVRHFSQRFRKIQRWYRFHLQGDAGLLAGDLNFDLTFVTRNLIGWCIIRCTFWLVSRKDDCLERVLRKSFWIKNLINKFLSFVELILINILEKQ